MKPSAWKQWAFASVVAMAVLAGTQRADAGWWHWGSPWPVYRAPVVSFYQPVYFSPVVFTHPAPVVYHAPVVYRPHFFHRPWLGCWRCYRVVTPCCDPCWYAWDCGDPCCGPATLGPVTTPLQKGESPLQKGAGSTQPTPASPPADEEGVGGALAPVEPATPRTFDSPPSLFDRDPWPSTERPALPPSLPAEPPAAQPPATEPPALPGDDDLRSILPRTLPNIWSPAPSGPGASYRPDPTSGVLSLRVPADAQVFVNDTPTTTPGELRQYVSRDLTPGQRYAYEVRVAVNRAGRQLEETKLVHLLAGETTYAAFLLGERPAAARATPATTTRLTLLVPADAKVELAGNETRSAGEVRQYATTQLTPGEAWEDYVVRVTVERQGRVLSREETIELRGGDDRTLRFDFDEPQLAVAGP